MPNTRLIWPFAVAIPLAGLFWSVVFLREIESWVAMYFTTGTVQYFFYAFNPVWFTFMAIYYLRLNRFPKDLFWIISLIGGIPVCSLIMTFVLKPEKYVELGALLIYPIAIAFFYSLRMVYKIHRNWIDYTKWLLIMVTNSLVPLLVFLDEYEFINLDFRFNLKGETFIFCAHMLLLGLFALNIYHLHLRQRAKMLMHQEAQIQEIGG